MESQSDLRNDHLIKYEHFALMNLCSKVVNKLEMSNIT